MIRDVKPQDATAITKIYNEYITNSIISFETEPLTEEDMLSRIVQISSKYPYLVYETGGIVVGYCYAHAWKERAAYRYTAETTVYLSPAYTGRGIGTLLMQKLIEECRNKNYRALIACITDDNIASKSLHIRDFIEAQGYSGTVKEIQIFNTILNTPDNKTIIIPNGGLSTGSLNNYSKEGRRRVDWKIGIAYGDDFDTARKAILELLAADKRVFDEPAPFVALSSLADSAIEITVRVWTASENYWGVFFDFNEQVYKQFDKYGLHFPYPQVDVHMIQDNH